MHKTLLMVTSIRQQFNKEFKQEVYTKYLEELHSKFADALQFRVAETPIFVSRDFKNKMLSACESIVDVITQPDFYERSAKAIPANVKVPNDKTHSDFIAFDFGVCENANGELEPQLRNAGLPYLVCLPNFSRCCYPKTFQYTP